jgi:hypothetical protein
MSRPHLKNGRYSAVTCSMASGSTPTVCYYWLNAYLENKDLRLAASPKLWGPVNLADVRFVPKAEIRGIYSISSSASDINDAGIVNPSAFADVRLMMNSNLVGCSTGKSDGFVPCSIFCTYGALRRKRSGMLAP